MTQDILHTIANHNKELVAQTKEQLPPHALEAQIQGLPPLEGFPFRKALAKPSISFICEVKKASPSKGLIASEFPYVDIAREYSQAGADAISCLTEPKWFLGALAHLDEITNAVTTPVIRKDFVIDPYQILEARLAGASAILLICSILSDEELRTYRELAEHLGMDALVEAHSEEEAQRALASGASIVGVNNRNLKDFSVDFSNATRLRQLIPNNVIYVAESGVKTPENVACLAAMGADAVLMGEVLMRSQDKSGLLARMRQAAAKACSEHSAETSKILEAPKAHCEQTPSMCVHASQADSSTAGKGA